MMCCGGFGNDAVSLVPHSARFGQCHNGTCVTTPPAVHPHVPPPLQFFSVTPATTAGPSDALDFIAP